jgi:hypothetical protein
VASASAVSLAVAMASALVSAAITAAITAALATMASTAASSACVYILSVETLSEFFLGSLANRHYLALEMESLACHLMVEVHLYAVCCHFYHNSRDYTAHAVHHRDCVTRYEKILANFSVNLECCLWKIDYS